MRILMISVALLASTSAVASETAAPAQDLAVQPKVEQSAKPAQAQEKKICKRVDAVESRLGGRKLCLTRKQWKEYESSM